MTPGKQHERAKDAYERVVADNPSHAKVLQQLGWLYHQDGSSFQNQDLAIQYLTKSLEADSQDAQSWYLLGRAYMAGQKYNKAYEAYQQAVYRDGRNPTFWCSIGVLYFQINQFRDALDAYSRAIRINPYISEVWFDLGSLYESCNNQISDAIDAYARASELDPGNPVISQRLQLLKTAQATGGQLPAAPGPQDVHPTAYASAVVPPPGLTGPPLMLQSAANRPLFRTDSRGPPNENNLPLPPPPGGSRNSPGPFRGGPPPPVILDESRHMPPQTPLAPMIDVDRYPGPGRDGPSRGPSGHHSLLLHQPVPHQQVSEDLRTSHNHHPEYLARPLRMPSPSASPPNRPRSPFPPPRYAQPVGPAQPSAMTSQRSPRVYTHEVSRPNEPELGWDRRGPPSEHHREWDRERRARHNEYPGPPPLPPHQYRSSRSPPPHRGYSPGPSPHSAHHSRQYWEAKAPSGPSSHGHSPPHHEHAPRRYDPRYDGREERGYGSPEGTRSANHTAPPTQPARPNVQEIESPRPTPAPEAKERRRRPAKDREAEVGAAGQEAPARKERKKRTTTRKAAKDEPVGGEVPKPFSGERGGPFKGAGSHAKGTPEPSISNGSASSNRPSPPGPMPRPPSRVVDDDYDEPGVAETLMGLASYRAPDGPAPSASAHGTAAQSPASGRGQPPSPRPSVSHRNSVSSSTSRSRHSSPSRTNSLKRQLSAGPEEIGENKRSRINAIIRKPSPPSGGRRTPVPSTRPSPIPFRTQPTHSPEILQSKNSSQPYPPSPLLPVVLPPHPRPIGAGLSSHNNNTGPINLPPIATLPSTALSPPAAGGPDNQMQVDSGARSVSPLSRSKLYHSETSPQRATPSPTSSRHSQEKMEIST
jgi:general transcriptional corepressor CYC8